MRNGQLVGEGRISVLQTLTKVVVKEQTKKRWITCVRLYLGGRFGFDGDGGGVDTACISRPLERMFCSIWSLGLLCEACVGRVEVDVLAYLFEDGQNGPRGTTLTFQAHRFQVWADREEVIEDFPGFRLNGQIVGVHK